MPGFPINPKKWFTKKAKNVQTLYPVTQALPKADKWSQRGGIALAEIMNRGNLFMCLVNLQSALQPIERALRRNQNTVQLIRAVADQISVLKQEAETVGEGNLAKAAGQLSEYCKIVSLGDVALDAAGLDLIRGFVAIFKSLMSDAGSQAHNLDRDKLSQWESRCESLIAKRSFLPQDIGSLENDTIRKNREAPPESEKENRRIALEPSREADGSREAESSLHKDSITEISSPVTGEIVQERESGAPLEKQIFSSRDEKLKGLVGVADDRTQAISAKVGSESGEDLIPIYDAAIEGMLRDVVISDSEAKTARECMELGESKPTFAAEGRRPLTLSVQPEVLSIKPEAAGQQQAPFEWPAHVDEPESTERRLLGVRKDEAASVEAFGIDDLEDLIFIGRKKG